MNDKHFAICLAILEIFSGKCFTIYLTSNKVIVSGKFSYSLFNKIVYILNHNVEWSGIAIDILQSY